jgi:hypothetical protein
MLGNVEGKILFARERKDSDGKVERERESQPSKLAKLRKKSARVGFSCGRTMDMGNFNFARLDIGITFNGSGERAIDCARSICHEILDREAAAVQSRSRENIEIVDADDLTGRVIRLTYGVTRSLKGYESYRFDVTVEHPVDDGVPIEEALVGLQSLTSKAIEAEFERVPKIERS